MPNYSLKCTKCDYKWEDFLWVTERDKAKCPKCGGKAETDWNSQGSILIQGKGFYEEKKVR